MVCEMDHQGRSLKSQFKLANKLGAAYVVALGSDEIASGAATLRNMDTHEETPVSLDAVAQTVVEAVR